MKNLLFLSLLFITAIAYAQPSFLWSETYGGSEMDMFSPVLQSEDGGFLLAGQTWSSGPDLESAWILKTNNMGTMEWEAYSGGLGWESFSRIIEVGGQVVAAGYSTSYSRNQEADYFVELYSGSGVEQCFYRCGGNLWEECTDLVQSGDGFAIAGGTRSCGAGNYDCYLVQFSDCCGTRIISNTYGWEEDDFCWDAQVTSDGGFILAGSTDSFGPDLDGLLIMTDETGNEVWSQVYQETGDNRFFAVVETLDGYVAAGDCDGDFWLVKVDQAGEEQWSHTYGGTETDLCRSLIETEEGRFALAGWTESFGAGDKDMWLLFTDQDGDSLWSQTFGGELEEQARTIIQLEDGGFAISGFTESYGSGNWDAWLIRLSAWEESSTGENATGNLPLEWAVEGIFPNPFNSTTRIRIALPQDCNLKVKVFDILGREISQIVDDFVVAGYHDYNFDGDSLPSGTYFFHSDVPGRMHSINRVVLVK